MGKGIGALAGLGAAAQGVAHGIQTGYKINQQRRADVFSDMMKGLMSDDDDAYNTAASHFGMPLRTIKQGKRLGVSTDPNAMDNRDVGGGFDPRAGEVQPAEAVNAGGGLDQFMAPRDM